MTLDLAMDSYMWHQKHNQQKKKFKIWILSKFKLLFIKKHYQESERQLQNERKYLQTIYLIRAYCLIYISHNPTTNKRF